LENSISTKNQEKSQEQSTVASNELADQQLDAVAGGTPGAAQGSVFVGSGVVVNTSTTTTP